MSSSTATADLPHVRALRRAVSIAGSQAKLAARLAQLMGRPISQQHISYWLRSSYLLPAEYWRPMEEATGGRVTREDLRPDIFTRAA